jgi:ADP-ribosylation factor GTPase-activating protein 1
MAAGQVARSAQAGAKNAQDGFTRFVEGPQGGGYREVSMEEGKKEFWDDFSNLADQRKKEGSSIGTSAMGKGPTRPTQAPSKSSQDEWDDW